MLMTNMWDQVDPGVGAVREQELAAEFVKPALDNGAKLLRHYNTTESAHVIIRAILDNRRTALQVQQELVDERREFDRTTVGEEINREVEESTTRLRQRVGGLQDALARVRNREEETRMRLEAEIAGLRDQIRRHTEGVRDMNADYEGRRARAETRWAPLWRWSAGISISSVLFYALWYCLRLYI